LLCPVCADRLRRWQSNYVREKFVLVARTSIHAALRDGPDEGKQNKTTKKWGLDRSGISSKTRRRLLRAHDPDADPARHEHARGTPPCSIPNRPGSESMASKGSASLFVKRRTHTTQQLAPNHASDEHLWPTRGALHASTPRAPQQTGRPARRPPRAACRARGSV
jgi:hypothetical protein